MYRNLLTVPVIFVNLSTFLPLLFIPSHSSFQGVSHPTPPIATALTGRPAIQQRCPLALSLPRPTLNTQVSRYLQHILCVKYAVYNNTESRIYNNLCVCFFKFVLNTCDLYVKFANRKQPVWKMGDGHGIIEQ